MPLVLTFAASFVVFAVSAPYLPLLIRALGYGPLMLGLLMGAFEIAGIAGPFILGWVSDRYGRFRPALALSYAFTALPLYPLVVFHHPAITFCCLVVLAIGVRSIAPVVDTAATISLGTKGNYGLYRSAGSISFIFAAMGLQYQTLLPLSSASSMAIWLAAATAFAAAFLPALPDRDPRSRNAASADSVKSGARSFVDAPFIIGLLIIALSRLAMTPINTFLPLFISEELRWNAVALMWALAAVVEIPMMILSSRIIGRFGSSALLAVSSAAIVARLLIYALFPTPSGVAIGQLLHALCYGLFHPAAVSFIVSRVPPERRATGMAMYLSLGYGLPTFLGSALGGAVVAWAGYRALFVSFSAFALASVCIYLAARKLLETTSRAW